MATSMGAIHRLDLTTDITHLIVGQIDTPKYKHVAKERPDITVLKPEWIQAMRDAWTSGEDFDVQALNDEHRLPALYTLQICITGFDDLEERQGLMTRIQDNGALYHGDLTRTVTHLIAKRPEGAKYDRAKQWGLKIVSLKWLNETLERGMVLEEALYDPLRPIQMQGQGAFVETYPTKVAELSSKRSYGATIDSLVEESGKRKLRRTMSARLNAHSQSMFAEMSAVEDSKLIKTEDMWFDTTGGPTMNEIPLVQEPAKSVSREITPAVLGAEVLKPLPRPATVLAGREQRLFSDCLFLLVGHPEHRVGQT
jgi:hypothetical protein